MEIGAKIRIAREAAGLTQEELGKRCGTTKQTIYKYEIGKVTNIPLDRLELIANAVGVTSAYLIGWEEPNTGESTSISTLSRNKKELNRFVDKLTEEQASLALRILRAALADG